MCFTIDHNHPTAKIAKENINCIKILLYKRDDLVSIVQSAPYFTDHFYSDVNNRFAVKIKKTADLGIVGDSIYEGLHSYSDMVAAMRQRWNGDLVYLESYIPKGSEYYYNAITGEYVSNALVVNQYKIIKRLKQ